MAATTVSFLWINTIYSEVNLDVSFSLSSRFCLPEYRDLARWERCRNVKILSLVVEGSSRFTEDSKLDCDYACGEGPASQTSRVCSVSRWCGAAQTWTFISCWSAPAWILHMMEIKMFSKGSMSSLVVKNDVYTYEITTLIQYCKSPNTPSLTLIPYELWAKVGNNSVSYH